MSALPASTDDCIVTVPAEVLPAELSDVAFKLVFFVSPNVLAVTRPRHDVLEVRLPASARGERDAVARDTGLVIERLMRGYRPLELRTLFRHGSGGARSAGGDDLTAQLLAKGWVRRHDAGLWAFGPEMTRLLEAIDGVLRDVARDEYGAPPHAFPALISAQALRRAGYLTSFPQNAGFVSHLPQSLGALTRFQEANAASPELTFPAESAPDAPEECLPPAVCYHRFRDLADRRIAGGSVVTARGTCFRYEARHNMRSLARLWSFQMREIIYAGAPDYVQRLANRGPAVLRRLLERLELSGWCESATDPFFVNVFGAKRYAQVAGELKFELRLPLGADESLAAGSLNLHLDYFGKAFGIELPDGAPVTSGCTAFGLERLALGFLAQHGLDERLWPDAVAADARPDAVDQHA